MTGNQKETWGQLIDRVDALQYALQLDIPAKLHVDALRKSIPEIAAALKANFIDITGENPWE